MPTLEALDSAIAARSERVAERRDVKVGDTVSVWLNHGGKQRATVERVTPTRVWVRLKLNGRLIERRRGEVEREL